MPTAAIRQLILRIAGELEAGNGSLLRKPRQDDSVVALAPGVLSLKFLYKSRNGIEDLVCGFVPEERLWFFVVVLNVASDSLLQLFG
jgi:hypothetical protein